MITQRQLDANRRNATHSTGPTSPEGLAAVRLNALTHGLTAAEIILPATEEPAHFDQLREAFETEYQPIGPTEQLLVEDMILARWRLRRARKMEPGFIALRHQDLKDRVEEYYSGLDAQAHLALVVLDDSRNSDTVAKMSRYEARFERSFHKALKELQRLQALHAEVSDSGNGFVSQNPIPPDPYSTILATNPDPQLAPSVSAGDRGSP